MLYAGDDIPKAPREVSHYYGNVVRSLFIINAILLLASGTTAVEMPLSEGGAVFFAIVLIILAGITNPAQKWIHYVNEVIAVLGVALFAQSALAHYRAGVHPSDPSFFFIEILSILFLAALYYSTKTVRAILLHQKMM
jgi:hypothetical protein